MTDTSPLLKVNMDPVCALNLKKHRNNMAEKKNQDLLFLLASLSATLLHLDQYQHATLAIVKEQETTSVFQLKVVTNEQ